MSNEIAGVMSLECIDGDLHIAIDVEFVANDVGFFAASVGSLVADVDEGLLLKHYVQFILGCEHADWVTDMYFILMLQWVNHRWIILRFFLLTLMKWKPLVKMKLVVDLSLGIKVWDILFYLPGKSDVEALSLDFSRDMIFMVRDVLETYLGSFIHIFIEIGWIELKFELLKLGSVETMFSRFWVLVTYSITNYP